MLELDGQEKAAMYFQLGWSDAGWFLRIIGVMLIPLEERHNM